MKVTYKRLTDMSLVKESMSAVRGKTPNSKPLDPKVLYEMLLSPHSTVRCIFYRIYVNDIPYYAQNHLVRHKIGVEPTVYSQRAIKGRGKLPQDNLIAMHLDLNAQSLLTMAKARLCLKADSEVREFMKLVKEALSKGDVYDKVLGKMMMTSCELYDGICPEIQSCGKTGVRLLKDIHRGRVDEVL
jgi:hypothetical protein